MTCTAVGDNSAFRALLALPPIQASAATSMAVPALPVQKTVTGDAEVDAVLWLQEVIATGQPSLIDKALEAAKRIKTPLKELGTRYGRYVLQTSKGNTMAAAFASIGFGDLEAQAERSIERASRRHEAISRFGSVEALFEKTAAERACEAALDRLRKKDRWGEFDPAAAAARFAKRPDLVPHTLADCLYAQEIEQQLYWLRHASDDHAGDHWHAYQAHVDYCFGMLATLRPRSSEEALLVLAQMEEREWMDREETASILRNLVGGGWQ